MRQNPRVFAAAALRRIHDQRSLTQRHAREAALQNLHLFAVQDVWPKVDVSSFELAVDERRNTRKGECRLCDVVSWLRNDTGREFLALRRRRVRANEHAV